jgi:hypothetical protein
MAIFIGDLIRVGNHSGGSRAAFATAAGTATDPTAVTLTVEAPDATLAEYGWPTDGADGALVRETTGRFYVDVDIDQDGVWSYRLAGTGAVQAVTEGQFYVQASEVVP